MTYQFQTLEDGKTFPMRQSFMEVWEDMFQYVKSAIDDGNLSWQLLDALWIEKTDGNINLPIYFYESRDHAIDNYGWKPPE